MLTHNDTESCVIFPTPSTAQDKLQVNFSHFKQARAHPVIISYLVGLFNGRIKILMKEYITVNGIKPK